MTFLISQKTIGKYDIASRMFEKYVLSFVILSTIFENVTTGEVSGQRVEYNSCRLYSLALV